MDVGLPLLFLPSPLAGRIHRAVVHVPLEVRIPRRQAQRGFAEESARPWIVPPRALVVQPRVGVPVAARAGGMQRESRVRLAGDVAEGGSYWRWLATVVVSFRESYWATSRTVPWLSASIHKTSPEPTPTCPGGELL